MLHIQLLHVHACRPAAQLASANLAGGGDTCGPAARHTQGARVLARPPAANKPQLTPRCCSFCRLNTLRLPPDAGSGQVSILACTTTLLPCTALGAHVQLMTPPTIAAMWDKGRSSGGRRASGRGVRGVQRCAVDGTVERQEMSLACLSRQQESKSRGIQTLANPSHPTQCALVMAARWSR